MGNEIDVHLGKRLRRRRRLLGLTQQQLAGACGEALEVPVAYFYDGLSAAAQERAAACESGGEVLASKETMDLIRAYYQLGERPRRRLLDLAKSLNGDSEHG